MKFVFNDLGTIKKEASKLHKLAKSHGLQSKLATAQNCIASIYGWKHFNEMSSMHNRIRRREFNIEDKRSTILVDGQVKYIMPYSTFKPIESATELEKKAIEGKKRVFVANFFKSLGVGDLSVDDFLQEYVSKSGMIKKFFKGKSIDVHSLSDIPNEQISRGTLISASGPCDRAEIYAEMALPRLQDNGGVLILEKSVAEKIIPIIESVISYSSISFLKLGNINLSFDNKIVHQAKLHPFNYDGGFSCPILSLIDFKLSEWESSRYSKNKGRLSHSESYSLTLLSSLLKRVGDEIVRSPEYESGFVQDTLNILSLFGDPDKRQAIKLWCEKVGRVNSKAVREYKDYLEKYAIPHVVGSAHPYVIEESNFVSPMFDALELLRTYTLKFFRFMGKGKVDDYFEELALFCPALDFPSPPESGVRQVFEGDVSYFSLTRRYLAGDIIIAVVDDCDEDSLDLSRAFFGSVRNFIAPMLGTRLDGTSSVEDPQDSIKKKMFVIDLPQCLSLGSTVVFTQMRALGIRWMVNVSNKRDIDEQEYMSLVANVGVFVTSSLITEQDDAIARETKMYRNSERLRDLLILQMSTEVDALSHHEQLVVMFVNEYADWERRWSVQLVDKCKTKNG